MWRRAVLALAALLLGAGAAARNATRNTPSCGIAGGVSGGRVVQVDDGTDDRCVSIVAPPGAARPMPVLFWFHGAGGSARNCGSGELGDLAAQHGFALVCGEALQDWPGVGGGQWAIPGVVTDATGTPCGVGAPVTPGGRPNEVTYLLGAINALAADPTTFDTSRLFFHGCSMGAAFSEYAAVCMHDHHASAVSAFAAHSTGLKVKGDGLRFPPDNYDRQYSWGECPTCQYWPIRPAGFRQHHGLKACVFANTGDGDFYRSAPNLVSAWEAAGNRAHGAYGPGGHCQFSGPTAHAPILECLDDGTGRLLGAPGPGPGPGPGPAPAPATPAPAPAPGGVPAACLQCFRGSCAGVEGGGSPCRDCMEIHRWECASACAPAPYGDAQRAFCG